MTADYTRVAVYDLRNAMWQEMVNAGILDPNDYYPDGFDNPLIPIIPSQQIPEFNNLLPGKPYITYNVIQKRFNTQWWISTESLIMEIISRDTAQIQTITNFLIDLFRRWDLSAKTINADVSIDSPFTFLWFYIEMADPVQPFVNEGGYMSGDLTVGYAYTREVTDPLTGQFA
jgi:hypothetical protein